MPKRASYNGDDRHVPIDLRQISRRRRILGLIALTCFVAAWLIAPLRTPLLLIAIFSGLGIGWVE